MIFILCTYHFPHAHSRFNKFPNLWVCMEQRAISMWGFWPACEAWLSFFLSLSLSLTLPDLKSQAQKTQANFINSIYIIYIFIIIFIIKYIFLIYIINIKTKFLAASAFCRMCTDILFSNTYWILCNKYYFPQAGRQAGRLADWEGIEVPQ